jgi:hypothetical protein
VVTASPQQSMTSSNQTILRFYLALGAACCAALSANLYQQAQLLGVLQTSRRWMAGILFFGLAAGVLAGLLAFTYTRRGQVLLERAAQPAAHSRALKVLSVLFFGAATWGMAWLFLDSYGQFFTTLLQRLPVFTLAALAGSLLLRAAFPARSLPQTLAFSTLLLAVTLRAALFAPDVTDYPFSLGWSETSRYYFASLFFSEQVYGLALPPPVLHPSRYLLQAVPFLLPGADLWVHRLWQVLLWVGLPLLTTWLLARRLKITDGWRFWLFVLYAFLFIYQGPLYYHLTLCLIPVLLGFDSRRFGRTLFFVLLGALWAGISRVNWIPVPGTLAAVLYLLENPLILNPGDRVRLNRLGHYLAAPAGWFLLGGLTGLGSQFAYAFFSGNEPEHFSTSFTSDLLWYRLLPNPTFPEGILPTVLLVSLPLYLIIGERLFRLQWRVHPVRLLGLGAVLVVFLVGGLVVSVKIGGGNNLHNLDAYLFFLLLVAASLVFNRVTTEAAETPLPPVPQLHWSLLTFALLLPVIFILQSGFPVETVEPRRVTRGLETVSDYAQTARLEGGEVLFIAERQLVTFDTLPDVPLIPDYERTYLMEMAMARAEPYLQRFYQELADQRFALIVSQPLNLQIKGAEEVFGEENDAWVKFIARPILCYYEPIETLRDVNLQFLVPKDLANGNPGQNCP